MDRALPVMSVRPSYNDSERWQTLETATPYACVQGFIAPPPWNTGPRFYSDVVRDG